MRERCLTMSRAHYCGLTLLFPFIVNRFIILSTTMLDGISGRPGLAGETAGRVLVSEGLVPNPKARLKEQFHEVCRFRHVAMRTEEAYWGWVVRLVRFFDSKINPRDMSGGQLGQFLAHLATERQVAASTQNQALHPVR